MPLRPFPPANGVAAAAAAHLGSFSVLPGPRFLAEAGPAGVELTRPHRVFTLGYDAARNGDLSAAVFAGWRLLVVTGNRVVAATETAPHTNALVWVDSGRFAADTAEAIERFDGLAELADGDFEFRLLRVPALYLMAAWLVGPTRFVVPFAPCPTVLDPGCPYTETAFLEALRHPDVEPFTAGLPPAD